MARSSLPIRGLRSLRSDGTAMRRYPYSIEWDGFEPKVPPPTPSAGVQAVRAGRPYGEFSPP